MYGQVEAEAEAPIYKTTRFLYVFSTITATCQFVGYSATETTRTKDFARISTSLYWQQRLPGPSFQASRVCMTYLSLVS